MFVSFQVAGDPSRKDETMSREYRSDAVGDVVSVSQEYRRFEDEDDGWGGFGGGGSSSGDSDGFSDRTSSIRRMLEEEDEDEDEDPYGSDEGEGGGGGGGSLPFYDRSPGEVYTIQEEEEEDSVQVVSSSSSAWDGELLNPDTASSLIRWRGTTHQQPKRNTSQPPPTTIPGMPGCFSELCCLGAVPPLLCASICFFSLSYYLSISLSLFLLPPICCQLYLSLPKPANENVCLPSFLLHYFNKEWTNKKNQPVWFRVKSFMHSYKYIFKHFIILF